ncbi:hypothetical protein [Bacteroides acidifaciens]|uniref:hypothetical protein n=1 Tax=Bacteroides acidifaciens TaxID=85831 RepID=UPI0025A98F48|nr:hypothetical protein [Bacteroides acidifaciens]
MIDVSNLVQTGLQIGGLLLIIGLLAIGFKNTSGKGGGKNGGSSSGNSGASGS